MKNFLSLFFSNYRWFRRWYGGKWALSYINLPLSNPFVWLPTWERPGCGLYWLEREDWGSSDNGRGDSDAR